MTRAREKLNALQVDHGVVTEKTLHEFRIAGKRARYIAELAGKDAEASRLIALLNHMQDVIGDWHDWIQLAERAEELFGGVQESALVAVLRNVTRAKFRQAVNTLSRNPGRAGREETSFDHTHQPRSLAPSGRLALVWVGHSCPTPLKLILKLPVLPQSPGDIFAASYPLKRQVRGSDRSVRPTQDRQIQLPVDLI